MPLEELSDQHILGQHQEWHMLEAMMRSKQFANHPLVRFFREKKPWLHRFHQELVFEMWTRFGATNPDLHRTPSPWFTWWSDYVVLYKHQPYINWPQSWIDYDREDLRRRSLERPKLRFKKTSPPAWWRKESDLELPLGPIPIHAYASPETFGKYTYQGVPT